MNPSDLNPLIKMFGSMTDAELKERMRSDDQFHELVMEFLEKHPEAFKQARKLLSQSFPDLTIDSEKN
jgi:hypothetical protein